MRDYTVCFIHLYKSIRPIYAAILADSYGRENSHTLRDRKIIDMEIFSHLKYNFWMKQNIHSLFEAINTPKYARWSRSFNLCTFRKQSDAHRIYGWPMKSLKCKPRETQLGAKICSNLIISATYSINIHGFLSHDDGFSSKDCPQHALMWTDREKRFWDACFYQAIAPSPCFRGHWEGVMITCVMILAYKMLRCLFQLLWCYIFKAYHGISCILRRLIAQNDTKKWVSVGIKWS